jgi:hypothetical protein
VLAKVMVTAAGIQGFVVTHVVRMLRYVPVTTPVAKIRTKAMKTV